jgi:hypothetical protein
MICKNRFYSETLRKMVLAIAKAYEGYCSAHFPASIYSIALSDQVYEKEIMTCKKRFHVKACPKMVLAVVTAYE